MGNAQTVKCKCGTIVAACLEPYCYEDVEWMRKVRKYSKKGYSIEMANDVTARFGNCTCNEKQISAESNLFNSK